MQSSLHKFCVGLFVVLMAGGCGSDKNKDIRELEVIVDNALEVARVQSVNMALALKDRPGLLPQTLTTDGELKTCKSDWWTSGFFPGVLWYLYEYTGDDDIETLAREFTRRVEDQKYAANHHDVGFVIFCSYGNGYRLTNDPEYRDVIRTAATSLSTRFDPLIGAIRSWDSAPWNEQWQYPVIIDNMMNLEILRWAANEFGINEFADIANTHAKTTMQDHIREDYSTYHVVSYDTVSGAPELKHTHQGYSHESTWARGQAWGLYGFTMMYRYTGNPEYLNMAAGMADFIIEHPDLPEDKIPYWDFDAPDIPNELRDASAGAIICSALLELSRYVDDDRAKIYMNTARTQLRTLSSPPYIAEEGTNGNFILKHGVGNIPGGTEIDIPLTYADYYFVEALMRFNQR